MRSPGDTLVTPQQSGRVRRRGGCLGCLWQIPLILALGIVLVVAINCVFAPWAFYLGGNFHILPYWQGWGKLHAKSGDYVMYIRIHPTSRGSRMYLETNLTGNAYICTPRGEQFRMHMGGGMRKHLNLPTDGEKIHLYMHNWPWNGSFIADHRPSLELEGHWQNPDLVMDDDASIQRAFQPDGSVYPGHDPNHPYNGEIVPVTFHPGSYSDFKEACKAR